MYNSHCSRFDKSKKKWSVNCAEAWGIDLGSTYKIGTQEDTHVLFFRLQGNIMPGNYIFVKFETHGINDSESIVEHLLSYATSRKDPSDCISSRKRELV